MNEDFEIAGLRPARGQRLIVDFPLPPLTSNSAMHMPIHVIRGRRPGPRLLVCAALHGDEIGGVEIIRRLVSHPAMRRLQGDLVAIPIVNVYGFVHHSRYLPDRRDLNRSFPGSENGPIASRLANLFLKQVVAKCSHGIDLHTAAIHRENLPQIRACLDDKATRAMAEAFPVPVLLDASLRSGTVREAAAKLGIPWLVYEAGEALRFDEISIRVGVRGIIQVMREIGMLAKRTAKRPYVPQVSNKSYWVRAPQSGIYRNLVPMGAHVGRDDLLGVISDPYGKNETQVYASIPGIIIGRTNLPLVYEGDALYHIALFKDAGGVVDVIEAFQSRFGVESDEGAYENEADAPII